MRASARGTAKGFRSGGRKAEAKDPSGTGSKDASPVSREREAGSSCRTIPKPEVSFRALALEVISSGPGEASLRWITRTGTDRGLTASAGTGPERAGAAMHRLGPDRKSAGAWLRRETRSPRGDASPYPRAWQSRPGQWGLAARSAPIFVWDIALRPDVAPLLIPSWKGL